ncbi:MAG: HU family DNA-binding protein [Pseudomonadota bacterium]|nr:MAG: HU family DNA-binding protein [Desulfobacteraceae bacterium]
MNKTDLIEEVESVVGSKKAASDCIDSLIKNITTALQNGEEVRLSNFGIFKVSKRKARTGVNPRTGEKINIPAKKVPVFSPSKGLKEAVN